MELIIDISEEVKQVFDNAESNDLKGGYYDHGGLIGKAIKNGTPLAKHDEEVIKETVESIWGKPPYIEHIDNLIDKCMETLFDVTLDKIATELKDLIKTVDDMGCSTKQFRVALGIVNQYRKGADK